MSYLSYTLNQLSERTLNMIASLVYGNTIDVILSQRLQYPACLVAQSCKIFLNPNLCGLYDLFLLAQLLKRRMKIKNYQDSSYVDDHEVQDWANTERESLLRRFPRISELDGYFLPEYQDSRVPKISWKEVEFTEYPSDFYENLGNNNVSIVEFTGVDMKGIQEDFDKLLASIENGKYPLQNFPDFPQMPVATVPARFVPKIAAQDMWEQLCTGIDYQDIVNSYLRCYLSRTQGAEDMKICPQHKAYGLNIDFNRLHDLAVSARSGHEIAIFRQKRRDRLTTFRPEQHFGILGVDINSLKGGTLKNPALNTAFLIVITRFFENLGIDFAILSFRDRVLHLQDGKDIYLHIPYIIKDIEEEMGPTVWARMEMAWMHSLQKGEHSSSPVVQIKTMKSYIEKASMNKEYKFYDFHYFNFHTLGWNYNTPAILSQTVQALESMFIELEETYPAEWYYYGILHQSLYDYIPENFRCASLKYKDQEISEK